MLLDAPSWNGETSEICSEIHQLRLHVSTCFQTAFSFTSPKGDSARCKSWKAEFRRSIEEGQVLEDAVGIGLVDDAICCDILKLHMWGACMFLGILRSC